MSHDFVKSTTKDQFARDGKAYVLKLIFVCELVRSMSFPSANIFHFGHIPSKY